MATLFVEEFEGGTAGAAVTNTNTAFNTVAADITFVDTQAVGTGKFGLDEFGATPFGGSPGLSAKVTPATAVVRDMRVTYSAARSLLFRRFYMYLPTLPVGTMSFASVRGGGTQRAALRVRDDGALLIQNGGTGVFTSPAGTIPAATWVRVEWRLDLAAGQQTVRLYHGANLYSTQQTYNSGPRTFTAGSIDQSAVGVVSAAQTTIHIDSVADDDADWVGPTAASATYLTVDLVGTNTLSVSLTSVSGDISATLSGAGTLTADLYAVPVLPPSDPTPFHEWVMFARGIDYAPTVALPILSAQMVLRHMGVDKAIIRTPYTEERWAELGPGNGITVWRDGEQEFTGLVFERALEWSAESGRAVIQADCEGDEAHLADRLMFPDPLRAADDQTVNDHWTFTGAASTAMLRAISDQAGPTCRSDRRVTGLVLGSDPGLGPSRKWSALFDSEGGVLGTLRTIGITSGLNLGTRVTASAGALRFDVTAPRDLSSSAVFSADMATLVGFTYSERAPVVTHALAAGAGDLKARLRRVSATSNPLATRWRRQRWSYIDRRDMGLPADLLQAAADSLLEGGASSAVTVTLADSDAATYRTDWGVGDRITIYVGLPGQSKPAVVSDVVREVLLTVDESGAETVRPAVGTQDTAAVPLSPSQRQLADVGAKLSNLIARK